jgi:hypothetical protein
MAVQTAPDSAVKRSGEQFSRELSAPDPSQERCISSNVSASFAEDRNPERTAFAFKSLSLIILVAAQFRNGLM